MASPGQRQIHAMQWVQSLPQAGRPFWMVDGVGPPLGTVFVVVPGADGLHCKGGGGALAQGYALSPAVVTVAVAA